MTYTYMTAGLLLFLIVHSVRVFADDWRSRTLLRMGELPYKGLYAALSLGGFMLMGSFYGPASQQGVLLWSPPYATRYLAAALTLAAFILLTAAYTPGNVIKAKMHHPMVLGTLVWALAHLLVNGELVNVLLFGGFLVWSAVLFAGLRRRDRLNQVVYPPGKPVATLIAVAIGVAAWAAFAFWLHLKWVGVAPFAGVQIFG